MKANDSNSPLIQSQTFLVVLKHLSLLQNIVMGLTLRSALRTSPCSGVQRPEYLGMTEDCSVGNLVSSSEVYLEKVALVSLSAAVTVLQKSEDLLPMSEKLKLVSRCIDAIVYLACNDNQFYLSLRTDNNSQESLSSNAQPKAVVYWGAEELMVLRIDTFQRVLMAMEAGG